MVMQAARDIVIKFKPNEIRDFGFLAAAVLSRFRFWLARNETKGINFHKGRTWTYSSYKEIARDLESTPAQIRHAVAKLVMGGLLIVERKYDNTLWFTLLERKVSDENLRASEKFSRASEKKSPPLPYKREDKEEDTVEYCTTPRGQSNLNARTMMGSNREVEEPRGVEKICSAVNFIGERIRETRSNRDVDETRDVANPHNRIVEDDPGRDGVPKKRTAPFLTIVRDLPVSDDTKTRLDAFAAVRGNAPPAVDLDGEPRRPNRHGKGRKPKPAHRDTPRVRPDLQCPVWDAWREAMSRNNHPTRRLAEKHDVETAGLLIAQLGSEAEAIAYVTWVIDNWAALTKKHPKLESFGRALGVLASRWMDTLLPAWKAGTPGSAVTEGSEAFRAYMALSVEEQAATDPQKLKITDWVELVAALDASAKARNAMWAKRKAKT